MNSRKKPTENVDKDGTVKKSYCDKQFKRNLVKALKNIQGEPDSIEKLLGNKNLQKYTTEKIIDYTNSLSSDIQKNVDLSIEDEKSKEIVKLANVMNSISGKEKSNELPLVMKLKAESDDVPDLCSTNGVNFKALHKFLYSSVSGIPDFTELNEKSLNVLSSTHQMLLEQIEHDATTEFLEELKSKICAGFSVQTHPGVAELSQIFQDKNLNPLSFPFEYLLNGSLPNMPDEETKDEPAVVFSKVIVLKDSPKESLL